MRFGLNVGTLSSYELATDKNGNPYFIIGFKIGDREIRQFGFPPKDFVYVKGKKSTAAKDIEAKDKEFREWCRAPLDAMLGKGVVDVIVKDTKTFADFAKTLISVLPDDWKMRELHVFCQYQWKIREGAERTYLETVPAEAHSQGAWVTGKVAGDWKMVKDPDNKQEALRFELEDGKRHRFIRDAWFLSSKYATVQKNEETAAEPVQAEVPAYDPVGDEDLPF